MRVGSTMPGLVARNSCQREPRPRFCCASFHRESPGCTVTVCSEEEVFATADGGAIEAATLGLGAIAGAMFGSAGRGENLGASNFGGAILEERFGLAATTGAGRDTYGRAAGAAGTGANLGDSSLGAAISLEGFGCGTARAGAGREADACAAGATGARRRVKGSSRRKGAGLGIAGATTALGWAGPTFGCTGEKLGRGGSSFGTEIMGAANTGSSNGRWNGSGICAARLASR